MFNDPTFHLQLHIIEVATRLAQVSEEEKQSFLQHIYDEYSAIDDEFIVIFDMMMEAMYQPPTKVERSLLAVIEQFRCPKDLEMAELLLNNILMYMNEY